jgi:hypothetical protein
MRRIATDTAETDKFGAGKNGFTNEDPGVVAATQLDSEWFDATQEEIVRVIEEDGTTPSASDFDQLRKTLLMLTRGQAASNWTDHTGDVSWSASPFGIVTLGYDWILFGSSITQIVVSDDNGETWATSSLSNTAGLRAGAHNGSDFMLVGEDGDAHFGTPGSWADVSSGAADFWGVAWHPTLDRWVRVGNGGVIETSDDDGGDWDTRSSGTTENFRAITWDSTNEQFVAVGADSTVLTSSDGATWAARTLGTASQALTSIVHDASTGRVWALTGATAQTIAYFSSADGITWEAHSFDSGEANSATIDFVSDGRGLFVLPTAAGRYWISTDPLNPAAWRLRRTFLTNIGAGAIGYSEGRFVLAGNADALIVTHRSDL